MFRIIGEGAAFREHVLLKDGLGLLLRPATPADRPLVTAFMGRVSPESLRMRFMAAVAEVSDATVSGLCGGDFAERGCLLAMVGEGAEALVAGVGNYVGMPGGRSAELAFLVEDAFQGRGISTLLLERLAGLAAANGYVHLEAEVLPDNQPMLNVLTGSGFEVHRVWGGDTVHVELPVGGPAALRERVELRERIAVANSLVPLLRPRVVAVAGASRDESAAGNMLFRHILGSRFTGTVYPVNPQATSVRGVRAYPFLTDLPERVDLAVIAVPAEAVQEVAENALDAGARGLVVVAAGFAEEGEEGAERQRRLVELVRGRGARLIGPSCLGLLNTDPAVRLNATLAPDPGPRGRVGFFSHSAALGLVTLDHAAKRGIGFSTFVCAGNRADVSGNDLLQYWEEDPDTDMALLYLETFGNPRRFTRIARRLSARKPILCVKGARSSAGRRAAEARSGQPGAREAEVEALFYQTGIIRADTMEELFDVAVLLAHQPLPRGNRVAVVANSAGVTTLFADAAEASGLELGGRGLVNLGAFTTPDRYREAVLGALADDRVDAVFVAYACVGSCDPASVTAAIGRAVDAAGASSCGDKPVMVCIMGAAGTVSAAGGGGRVFPAYRFPESAPRALARALRYAEFRAQPPGKLAWYDDADAAEARRVVLDAVAAGGHGPLPLGAEAGEKVLACFGLKVVTGKGPAVRFRVRPDPLFGPLLELEAAGRAVERITPLTDRDIGQLLGEAGLAREAGLGEALGRLSQLVEELPWVWSMEGSARLGDGPAVGAGAAVTVRRAEPASSLAQRG